MQNPIHLHRFSFNPKDNGGEQLVLETKYMPNGDPGEYFTNQVLTLYSYCNEASFQLVGTQLTPNLLRKLADELEQAEKVAEHLTTKLSGE